MIVLDASAALEFVLNTELGGAVAARLADADQTLHAPHLIDLEVLQVLRRFVRGGSVDEVRGSTAVTDFADLDIARYPHDALAPRIWQLRDNLSAYDAAYVALAEALGATLLTTDRRLANAPGHAAQVALLA